MDTKDKIKQKLDIVDVIGGYISLKKSGRNYKAPCPFHNEDTPSFMVTPELQIYKCFGCGEGGDIFTFIEKTEGVTFVKALEILADKAGIELEQKNLDPNYKKKTAVYDINALSTQLYSHLLLKHPAGKKGLEYLTDKRKLNLETIKEFKLGYAPDKWDTLHQFLHKKNFTDDLIDLTGSVNRKRSGDGYVDKFRGRVMFPLIDVGGKTVGFTGRDVVGRDPKYLNTPETLVYHKSEYLYGMDKAKLEIKKKGAVFVEGQMDVIKSHQHGIKNVIASSGTAVTSAQLRILARYTKQLTLCFDPDTAGMKATARALELTNQHDFEVKVCIIPPEYADLDEFVTADPRAAKMAIKNAVQIYDFYLVHALKQFKKEDAYGKKKIVEYLAPLYSKIPNKVVQDHYVKKLSEQVGIAESAIRASLNASTKGVNASARLPQENKLLEEKKKSAEEYLLSLILKTDIDTMGSFLYKLELQNFESAQNRKVFTELENYINSKPERFDIKYFTGTLEDNFAEIVKEMYLWDFGKISSTQDLLVREINATISRLEKETTKKKLKDLTEQIKLAEMEKNTKELKELSKQFKKLSETLL